MSKRSKTLTKKERRELAGDQYVTVHPDKLWASGAWEKLEPELQATALLAHFSPGIARSVLVDASMIVCAHAKARSVHPVSQAIDLLKARDMTAQEREQVMPDPVLRTKLDAFFKTDGPRISDVLAPMRQARELSDSSQGDGNDEDVERLMLESATALIAAFSASLPAK